MKILVCFKVVTDYDKVSPKEIKKGDFSYTKKDFGFFDNGALELSLRLKDKDKSTTLSGITYGEYDELFFNKLYSLGFDKVINIKGKEKVFSSRSVAKELFNNIKERYDLILTGEMVGPNDTGSFPYYLANYLNLPLIDKVTNFDDKKIYTENGLYYINGPLVLVISNSIYPYLRFPSFKDRNIEKEVEIIPSKRIRNPKLSEVKREAKKIEYIDVEKLISILEVKNV